MIKSFRSNGLKRFARTGDPSKLSVPKSADRIRRILTALDNARHPRDMALPGYDFHPLKGDRKGDYAVTVIANWRITWAFDDHDVVNVNLEDYH